MSRNGSSFGRNGSRSGRKGNFLAEKVYTISAQIGHFGPKKRAEMTIYQNLTKERGDTVHDALYLGYQVYGTTFKEEST